MNPASPSRWPAPVRALRHRNFQIYFVGQGLSTLGKWVQQVALSWLAYHLTGSAVLLGAIAFLTLLPQLLVGPLAGAWSDRHDKRRLLMAVQAALALQSLALAVLTWQQWIGREVIIAMALLLGLLNALETPLRQALIASFVDEPKDLPNALVLNAMLINAARFIGPPLAGLLINWSGEAGCFVLTSIAFGMLLIGLGRVQSRAQARAQGSTGEIFREGLRYLWTTLAIRRLLVSVVMVNLLASCYTVLLPILAKHAFSGDAQTLGWLWGAAGAGAFVATIFLAFAGSASNLGRFIVLGTLACAVSLCAVAANPPLWFTLAALAGLGFGITVSNVSSNMTLQSAAPEALRGRVIAFYIAMRFGFEAIGGLLAGLLAAALSVQWTLLLAGLLLGVYQGVSGYISRRRG
ncbi:MFS transporter [Pseudomonas marginalis]|uniref:MFS transporter n=1 Tax=Pseudomonas marginalis TaxID=298 RepID=UPI00247FD83F|nr:MFS transporter [Pseudomonas marginalis]WGT28895.1 MFS transporter [Pseudomonas marginalis]